MVIKESKLFLRLSLFLLITLLLLVGCSKRKIVDEINIGHNGRNTQQVKDFMLGVYANDVVFDIDNIKMDISFGVNNASNSLDELGFVYSSKSDIVLYVHWLDTKNDHNKIENYDKNIDLIPNFQILSEYNIVEFLDNNYLASYKPKGFLGNKGETTFNHTEIFLISKKFVDNNNYTGKFTIGIAIINYFEDETIQVITMNSYDFRFGNVTDDKVYIRYWADAIKDKNMG